LIGAAGSDTLDGNGGNDVLNGGADPDSLFGGSGNDSLDGQAGNDSLWGQAGDDILLGSDGDDSLNGGTDSRARTARDTVNGGGGNDNILTQGSESEFDVILGGAGVNTLTNVDTSSRPVDLILNEFLGMTNGIRVINGNGARIRGNDSDNDFDFRLNKNATDFVRINAVPAIDGGAGDDEIYGTNGVDTLFGSAGNDTLFGYGLADRLDGGERHASRRPGRGYDFRRRWKRLAPRRSGQRFPLWRSRQ
jgi:Ca2+-binding RTX toxin-like protein